MGKYKTRITNTLATLGILAVLAVGYSVALGGIGSESVIVVSDIFANNIANQGSAPTMVWTSPTDGYAFFLTAAGAIAMASTTDAGATWTATPRTVDSVNTTDAVGVAVWYDRWTQGDTGNKIHIATTDTSADDTYYTELDLSTGALSTSVVAVSPTVACVRTTNSCLPTITKTEDGVLLIGADDGTAGWVDRCAGTCTTTGNWAAVTGTEYTSGDFQSILTYIPSTNNALLIFKDSTNAQVKYNVYSATTTSWWGIRTLASSIQDNVETGQMSSTVSTSSDLVYLTSLDYNTGSADGVALAWSFSSTTWEWTALTNPTTTTKGTLRGGSLAYDPRNDDLHYAYNWASSTSATQNVYYVYSTDMGTTWTASSTLMGEIDQQWSNNATDGYNASHFGFLYKYNAGTYTGELFYNKILQYLDPSAPPTAASTKRQSEIWFD